jgi:hypothetical protein
MGTVVAITLCLSYFVGVIVGTPFAGPALSPWFLVVWSAAYDWSYLTLARGRAAVALAIVFLVTLLLPVVALVYVGWPDFASLPELCASYWSAFQERGLFGAFEFLAPIIAAALSTVLIRRFRSPAGSRRAA